MTKQVIHDLSLTESKNNNYSKVNVIETRISDQFNVGEFEGTSVRLKLRYKSSVVDKVSNYRFSEGHESSICVAYERSRVQIEAVAFKELDNDIDLDNFRLLGTNNKLSGVRIILKAIPNENFQEMHTEAYLTERDSPYLQATDLRSTFLTFKIHLPVREIDRHIAEIEAGNTAEYEIDFDEGVYRHIDKDIDDYRIYPVIRMTYGELDGLKPLNNVYSLRIEYIKKSKVSLFETILQKLGF